MKKFGRVDILVNNASYQVRRANVYELNFGTLGDTTWLGGIQLPAWHIGMPGVPAACQRGYSTCARCQQHTTLVGVVQLAIASACSPRMHQTAWSS